jgi:phosphate transport system substrate-binding protein
LWALASALAAPDPSITIKGSDTMLILGQKWAEAYMRIHPRTKVQVTGGGSGTGFAALQNRQTDLAQSSRRIRPEEVERFIRAFRGRPREHAVALDSLTLYVNSQNPVEQLSLPELRDIYTGRITNWSALRGPNRPIVLYSRENSSGSYEFFKEKVLLGRDFSPRTQTLAGTAQVIQQVGLDPNGIGYGGSAYGQGAKHIRIAEHLGAEAVEPSESSVASQRYPVWRYLYVYLSPENPKRELESFLHWVRGSEGQAIASSAGYYPLPEAMQTR